jgi:hypothetical protein
MQKKQHQPKQKPEAKPKLTDTERHKRFVDMAHEIGADESPEAFDRAFDKVVPPKPEEGRSHPSVKPASS